MLRLQYVSGVRLVARRILRKGLNPLPSTRSRAMQSDGISAGDHIARVENER
jgi:hypothetical protein